MAFAFEELQVYQRALNFAVFVIDIVEEMDAPRKHYRLIEQLEASCTSVALNISEGKGRFSKKELAGSRFVQYVVCRSERNKQNAFWADKFPQNSIHINYEL